MREGDVGGDGEVREEGRLLRGVGDRAVARWRVGEVVFRAIVIRTDECGVGMREQAGEGAQDSRLAAAGGAEEDGPVVGEVEVDIEGERAELSAELEAVVVLKLGVREHGSWAIAGVNT